MGVGGEFQRCWKEDSRSRGQRNTRAQSEMRTRFVLCGEVGQGPLMGLQKLSSPGAIP